MMKNLLIELFVEELPPKSLKKLGDAFGKALAHRLAVPHALLHPDVNIADKYQTIVKVFASPRRLAVLIRNVHEKAENTTEEIKLMPIKVGLDQDGNATPALLKKLAALGESEAAIPTLRLDEAALYLDRKKAGATLAEGLQEALEYAIGQLPIPKVMTYQLEDGWSSVKFVRPAHGLVALHGKDIVPVSALGLIAGRSTLGHRFESAGDAIAIADADSYETQMEEEGAVIPGFDKRRAEIERQLREAAAKAGGGVKPIKDEALLDEVTALVERPNVLVGKFDEAFLEVPQECLILTMKANQKYFPLLDGNGKLNNRFLIVSNIRPDDASLVVTGNERVVRPRLADAKFFFDQDRKRTLASRVEGLKRVVYHNKLGSLGERTERVWNIAQAIGFALGGQSLASRAGEAAMLSKADLLTDMVGEFPELQGIMGRYYALHDGHSPEIAFAIEDHYRPRFAGDELPRNETGMAVALADKLETLGGLFSIGQTPTGDKDPYALRRQALGIIRILMENGIALRLAELLAMAAGAFPNFHAMDELENFIRERLAGLLREQGYSPQEIDAVLVLEPQVLSEIPERLEAVRAFMKLSEAESLAAANKRVSNILKKAEGEFANYDPALLQDPAEKALHARIESVMPIAEKRYLEGDYVASLMALAELKEPVDAFFDKVMVNVEDDALRANRLGLLSRLREAMNRVADISRLAS